MRLAIHGHFYVVYVDGVSNNIVVIQYSNNKYVATKSSGLAFIAIDYYYAYNYNRLLI